MVLSRLLCGGAEVGSARACGFGQAKLSERALVYSYLLAAHCKLVLADVIIVVVIVVAVAYGAKLKLVVVVAAFKLASGGPGFWISDGNWSSLWLQLGQTRFESGQASG